MKNNPNQLNALHFTAHVGCHEDLWAFLLSYEEAVEVLYKSIAAERMPPDLVSMPLLFLMRHCLELGYKATIEHLHKLGGKKYNPKKHCHSLCDMHTDLRKDFIKYCIPTPSGLSQFEDYYKKTEECMNLLNTLDSTGTGFRYPNDSQTQERVSLLKIKNSFDAAMTLLKTTADVFPDPSEYR